MDRETIQSVDDGVWVGRSSTSSAPVPLREEREKNEAERRRLWRSDRSELNNRSTVLFGGITEESTTQNSYQFDLWIRKDGRKNRKDRLPTGVGIK